MGNRYAIAVVAAAVVLAAAPALAQSQLPRPSQMPPAGGQMQPPQRGQAAPQQPQQAAPTQQQQQAAPPRPYKPVAVSMPAPYKDADLEAFRKRLGEVAERKDRKALAGLVAKNFFWLGEKGDKADKKRPGIDNLARALELDDKEGGGWEALAGFAADPTGAPLPERKGTICAPAAPSFNGDAFDALVKASGTDDADWGFPFEGGLEMRAAPQPNAPLVEKLGMHFVRVMLDDAPPSAQNPMLRVVSPSGKVGYVPADALSPLGSDEICYVKEGNDWKIAGYIGGE